LGIKRNEKNKPKLGRKISKMSKKKGKNGHLGFGAGFFVNWQYF